MAGVLGQVCDARRRRPSQRDPRAIGHGTGRYLAPTSQAANAHADVIVGLFGIEGDLLLALIGR